MRPVEARVRSKGPIVNFFAGIGIGSVGDAAPRKGVAEIERGYRGSTQVLWRRRLGIAIKCRLLV